MNKSQFKGDLLSRRYLKPQGLWLRNGVSFFMWNKVAKKRASYPVDTRTHDFHFDNVGF